MASKLNMTARSLQRKLKEEGTSYRDIVSGKHIKSGHLVVQKARVEGSTANGNRKLF